MVHSFMNNEINSLGAIIDKDSKVLILGSIPGKQSLEKQEYYGNNRNAFWKIIYSLYNSEYDSGFGYDEKIKFLKEKNIAVWDVIESCNREGSLDTNIKNEEVNDFEGLFKEYPNIKNVFFNGGKAYDVFKKRIGFEKFQDVEFEKLTSTSPANTITFERKLDMWRVVQVQPLKVKQ